MAEPQKIYVSGQLEVDLGRRELRVRGTSAVLGDRAFEVLEILVEAAGNLVTKDQLMRRVWPGVVVEDNTLEVHVSALRRALGSHRGVLKTAYGRGYRILGTWTIVQRHAPTGPPAERPAPATTRPHRNNLPIVGSRLIGRAVAVRHLSDLLTAQRIVTLAGVGGIGKTRLALEVAHGMATTFKGDICFVELASLSAPHLLPSEVARVFGINLNSGDFSAEAVARALGNAAMLLVLDNCEHVIDAAAEFVDAVIRLCPQIIVLTTSREVLRVEGEHVYRVSSLDIPPLEQNDIDQIVEASAAHLFVDRVQALNSGVLVSNAHAGAVASICRRLDGIPLAIEFAAARAAAIGIDQVAEGLADRFAILTVGRRTALPRHQTLRATLDWSYNLLSPDEAALFRCLSIFTGSFSLQAAIAVAGNLGEVTAVDLISSLISKSLVVALVDTDPHYRLLETVRFYASEKLRDSGDYERTAKRHAQYHLALSDQANLESKTLSDVDWLTTYGRHLDDWRVALDWAFSPRGEAEIGLALAASSLPLWFRLSSMSECRDRAKQALASATEKTDSHIKMRLSAGLAAALFYTQKGAVPEVAGLWSEVIAIADHLKDTEYRLWGRWGLWNHQLNHGLFRAALQTAQTFRDLAAESADLASGDRMVGVSLHYLGQQTRAREHLEYVLKRDVGVAGNSIGRIQYDPKLAARAYLPRVLWLQGFPEQAMEAAEKAISDAHESGHVLTSALVLVQAGCPIALLTGELEKAESYVAALLEIATKHNLSFWRAEAQCHEGILQVRRGDITTGLRVFRIAANELIDLHTTMNLASYHTAMAAALVETMMVTEFQEVLAAALARAEQDEDYWCMPEIIRLRGEFFLKIGSLDKAEGQFQQALNLATRQETLSWALRAAMSLARVMRDQNRPTEARGTLLPIYQKFDEGFATEDLLQAKSLLESLG